jgi:hypothetical protein
MLVADSSAAPSTLLVHSSIFTWRFLPNFGLDFLNPRCFDPAGILEADEVVEASDELEDCMVRRIPGSDSSSILCWSVDAYNHACDFSWKSRYRTYVTSKMTLMPLLTLRTATSVVLVDEKDS